MSLYDDVCAGDLEAFLDTDGPAETISYRPSAGGTLALAAYVTRNPPEKPGYSPRALVAKIQVVLARSALAAAPVLDGDKIVLSDGAKVWTVVKLDHESDRAAWHLTAN